MLNLETGQRQPNRSVHHSAHAHHRRGDLHENRAQGRRHRLLGRQQALRLQLPELGRAQPARGHHQGILIIIIYAKKLKKITLIHLNRTTT